MTSTQWVEYHVGTKRKSYNSLPTSNITAEAVTVDGFTLSQTDNAGRSYTANGMILTETNTVIECAYDHMGRRATKKVTVDGDITLHQRYIYRGYLQIDSGAPLCAFTLSGQTLCVCPTGLTAVVRFACCDLTRSNHPALWLITWDPTQPIATRPLAIQWSSEYNDTELGLVYYNYRHYNPMDGRWAGRDSLETPNLYKFGRGIIISEIDILGNLMP